MSSVYLVIAHGSREAKSNQAFWDFLDSFQRVYPHRSVQGAFLELAKPNISEAIEKCIADGATEITIIPLMLFPGRHVKDDIPRIMEEARAKHSAVDFHYAGPLADHPAMLTLLEEKAKSLAVKDAR